jgi:hypothetical protein
MIFIRGPVQYIIVKHDAQEKQEVQRHRLTHFQAGGRIWRLF